jgi:hypothetical protein
MLTLYLCLRYRAKGRVFGRKQVSVYVRGLHKSTLDCLQQQKRPEEYEACSHVGEGREAAFCCSSTD